ncbi:hypothetical protein MTO96_051427 [Rhipicephalus appendiculatus]
MNSATSPPLPWSLGRDAGGHKSFETRVHRGVRLQAGVDAVRAHVVEEVFARLESRVDVAGELPHFVRTAEARGAGLHDQLLRRPRLRSEHERAEEHACGDDDSDGYRNVTVDRAVVFNGLLVVNARVADLARVARASRALLVGWRLGGPDVRLRWWPSWPVGGGARCRRPASAGLKRAARSASKMSEGNRCHRGWIKTEVQHKSFTFGAPAAEGIRAQLLSAERVEQLSSQVERAQLVQQQLEHKMDYIAAQQRELKRLQAQLEATMTQAPALPVQQQTDLERENPNHIAENINSELNSDKPLHQISKVLNSHVDSLTWVQQNSVVLNFHFCRQVFCRGKLQELERACQQQRADPLMKRSHPSNPRASSFLL